MIDDLEPILKHLGDRLVREMCGAVAEGIRDGCAAQGRGQRPALLYENGVEVIWEFLSGPDLLLVHEGPEELGYGLGLMLSSGSCIDALPPSSESVRPLWSPMADVLAGRWEARARE